MVSFTSGTEEPLLFVTVWSKNLGSQAVYVLVAKRLQKRSLKSNSITGLCFLYYKLKRYYSLIDWHQHLLFINECSISCETTANHWGKVLSSGTGSTKAVVWYQPALFLYLVTGSCLCLPFSFLELGVIYFSCWYYFSIVFYTFTDVSKGFHSYNYCISGYPHWNDNINSAFTDWKKRRTQRKCIGCQFWLHGELRLLLYKLNVCYCDVSYVKRVNYLSAELQYRWESIQSSPV